VGIGIGSTLEVAKSPALDAAFELTRLMSDLTFFSPNAETAVLFVTQAATRVALYDITLCALTGLVADLITLEAQLFVAVEGVVRVFSAQNAVHSGPIVWALESQVAKLLAVAALESRVVLVVVASDLVLHAVEFVVR
jgi:hypothetical protein